MRGFNIFVQVLLIIAAINWGLVGAFNFNLVSAIFGSFDRAIYVIVGLAGLYELFAWKPVHASLAPGHARTRV